VARHSEDERRLSCSGEEVVMRRWLVVATMITGSLGWAGAAGVVEAKVPGPNGRILFVRDTPRCDDCHLTTVNPDGTHAVRVPNGSIARWSPDGERIATIAGTSDGRLSTMVFDPDGSNGVLFDIPDPTLNVACAAWAPDNSRLLCEGWDETRRHRAPGLFTVNATDGQDLVRLTSSPFGGHDIPGDYSPDGARILFLREDPERRHRQLSVWVADADGTDQAQVTPWLSHSACCQASWSPDGGSILFASKGRLRTVAPDGTGPTAIPVDTDGFAFAYQPGWSPDGTRIVFSMFLESTGHVDLFTVAADGTGLVQLTDSRSPEEFSDWGPYPPVTDA
jgi:Tol biopolymer transport system component